VFMAGGGAEGLEGTAGGALAHPAMKRARGSGERRRIIAPECARSGGAAQWGTGLENGPKHRPKWYVRRLFKPSVSERSDE